MTENKDSGSTKEGLRKDFSALYPLYRAGAMEQVAVNLGVSFKRVKAVGEKYKDVVVPQGMVYVSVDPGDKRGEFWKMVDTIAPPPTHEEIASGVYLH